MILVINLQTIQKIQSFLNCSICMISELEFLLQRRFLEQKEAPQWKEEWWFKLEVELKFIFLQILILLFASSSMYFLIISIKQYSCIIITVKMKSSKSQKNIRILTDSKLQNDLFSLRSPSNISQSLAHQNSIESSSLHPSSIQSTQKNKLNYDISQNKGDLTSNKKQQRRRSSSVSSNKQESLVWQQMRKKELDSLCLQRLIHHLKKYLFEIEDNWNFQKLSYSQVLKLLWVFRFVKFDREQQYIKNNEQQELKRVYLLWLSISIKKFSRMKDLFQFIAIIENISVEEEKIESGLNQLKKQLQTSNLKEKQSEVDPHYTFFIKKLEINRISSSLEITESLKQRIAAQFKSFKFNKLKDMGFHEQAKSEEQDLVFLSKKSAELADNRRKKIQQKIKKKKPHIQNINLLDLLSYRQRDLTEPMKKQVIPNKKSSIQHKKHQLKKQIEVLSKPKTHSDNRRQDEIIFQKQQRQFTFHPKINPPKLHSKDKIMNIKNADKVLVRMKEARKQKQEKQNILQKGYKAESSKYTLRNKQNQLESFQSPTKNMPRILSENSWFEEDKLSNSQVKGQKSNKYQVSKDYLRIPILYIDVNIEQGKKQRIIIYDDDKALDLANKFGHKHKLSDDTIDRLSLLLQQQMDTVLARIQEQTDDQCSIIY